MRQKRTDDDSKASFKLDVIEAANGDLRLQLPIKGKAGKRNGKAGKSALAVLTARVTQMDWPSKRSCMSRAIISGKTGRMSPSTIGEADKRLIAAGYLEETGETYKGVPVYIIANPRPDEVKASIREIVEYNLVQEAERKQEWRERKSRHNANVLPSIDGTVEACPDDYERDKNAMSQRVSAGCPTECRRDIPLYPTKGKEEEDTQLDTTHSVSQQADTSAVSSEQEAEDVGTQPAASSYLQSSRGW